MLGVVAKGLALFRAIDAAESDSFRMRVVQDFDGVAVEDGDHGAGDLSVNLRGFNGPNFRR